MSRGDFGAGKDVKINFSHGYADKSNEYSSSSYGDSEYIRLSNCVSNNIQQLTRKVGSIQQMVNQIGTKYDVPELFEKLQNEQKDANNIAKETSMYLKQLSQIQSSNSASRHRKIQQDKLQESFSDILHGLQNVQRLAVQKEADSVRRARAKSMEQGFQNYGEHSDSSPMKDNSPQFLAQEEADLNIDMIREREDALRQLESDIVNVNEIFKDLAIMVHEQGETIDSIEANVDLTQAHVEQANVQLQKAKTHQKAARKKKCCLILILLVVLIGIGVAIYFIAK